MEVIRDFYNTRIKAPLVAVFKQGLSPQELALSFAFGISGGVFPLPGITTLVCFVFIYFFKLNIAATQIVNFLVTPIGVACVIPFITLGNWILGIQEDVSAIATLFQTEGVLTALRVAGSSILRGIFAWILVVPFLTVILYFVLLPLVKRALPEKQTYCLNFAAK